MTKNFDETEPVYSVSEAMRLTGFSSTKFRYEPNMRKLEELGADVTGSVWRIPRSALITLGWISEDLPSDDATLIAEQTPRRSHQRIITLANENKSLKIELQEAKQRIFELEKQVAALDALVLGKNQEISNLSEILRSGR